MSGDPEQEYFADGMVEDIITGLSRYQVAVRHRAQFDLHLQGPGGRREAGRPRARRALRARRQRAQGRQIACASPGSLSMPQPARMSGPSATTAKFDDIFALQDEITLSVVGAIEPSLRLAEIERVKRKRPDSLDAYDLVLRALPDVYSRMPEQAKKALVLLERALALDPNYALAHACAAECHHALFLRGGHQRGKS